MAIPEGATFVDRKDKLITEGYVPPIHDFTMVKEDSDYKEELLQEPKLLMFVTYDLATAEEGGMLKLQKLNLEAKAKGYKVIGMTASSPLLIAKAQKNTVLLLTFILRWNYFKTIERANQVLLFLKRDN
jgi:hypothetical protein